MKTLQLYYPEERIRLHKEDASAIDDENGIFVVADGVHLREGIEYKGRYPNPSPAGRLAKKFCDNFLKYARGVSIEKNFSEANRSVFSINKKRNKLATFSEAKAYFAATGAFGRIKNRVLEWGNICDSGVVIIDAKNKVTFWQFDHSHHGPCDELLKGYSVLDVSYMLRTIFRNAISSRGEKLGYGVITGESLAEAYAHFGKRLLRKGDIVVFATDGFEKYLGEKSFRVSLRTFDKRQIEYAMSKLKKSQAKDDFVSERTLIAVQVD